MKKAVFISTVLLSMLGSAVLYFNDYIDVDTLNLGLLIFTGIWFLGSFLIQKRENSN
jgi:hypothetical protein